MHLFKLECTGFDLLLEFHLLLSFYQSEGLDVFHYCQASSELDLIIQEVDLSGLLEHAIVTAVNFTRCFHVGIFLFDVHVVHDGGQVLIYLHIKLQHECVRPQQLRFLRNGDECALVDEVALCIVLDNVESGLDLSRRLFPTWRAQIVLSFRVSDSECVQNDQYFWPLFGDQRQNRQIMEEQLLMYLQLILLLLNISMIGLMRLYLRPRRFEF